MTPCFERPGMLQMAIYKRGTNTRVGFPSKFAEFYHVTEDTRWEYTWTDLELLLWMGDETAPIPTHNTRTSGTKGQFSLSLSRKIFRPEDIGEKVYWKSSPPMSLSVQDLLREAKASLLSVSPLLQKRGCLGDGTQPCPCLACRIQRELDAVAPFHGSPLVGHVPRILPRIR